jgi:choline dehydrogenase-like flavoprotein
VSFDVIVIGAGAGGLAAAYKLTSAGKRTLVIERGPRVRASDTVLDGRALLSGFDHRSTEVWQDVAGQQILPEEFSNVGGKTKWYGGALLRMIPREFQPDPSFRALGWPVSYEEFSRHYEEAEALFSPEHFVNEDCLGGLIRDICGDGRWTCEPIPLALKREILNDQYHARYFDGYVSAMGYKNDAESIFLQRIGADPDFKMITGVEVTDLLHADTAPERITGVVCSDGTVWRGRAVIAAAGAMRSPLLLQRHLARTGLAGSPLIGALFKKHLMTTVLLISLSKNHDVMRKTAMFLSSRYPHTTAQCLAGLDVERLVHRLPNMVPRAVATWLAARCTLFFVMTEDGSHQSNAVKWSDGGPPLVDYDTKRLPEAEEEHRQATRHFCWRLRRSGRLVLARWVGLNGTGHAVGTLAAGDDPETSVVDGSGKVHRMQGLYIADGSALPRSGRVNPGLTIYAWGLRVGELLSASLDAEKAFAK